MQHSGDTKPASRRSFWFWILGAAVAVVLGAWGQWEYERKLHPDHTDLWSVVYHSLQLLILHAPHLEHHDVPWMLHAGRLLGAALLFYGGIAAATRVFHQEYLGLRLRLRTSHHLDRLPWRRAKRPVLVCGLGDLGLRMALEGAKRGEFVVAIEREGAARAIERARAAGVLVLEGDVCDSTVLLRSRASRSSLVLAACNEDSVNLAVAANVGAMVAADEHATAGLECRVLLQNTATRDMLAQTTHRLRTERGYRINVEDLDLVSVGARQAFERYPLDFQPVGPDSDTRVHLLLVGFGPVARSLALQAMRVGHFANEVTRGIRLRITIVAEDPQRGLEELRALVPEMDRICDCDSIALDPQDAAFSRKVAAGLPAGGEPTLLTCAVCVEDDELSYRVAIELARILDGRTVQLLVRQSTRCGFAAWFLADAALASTQLAPHPFGMKEDIYDWDIILQHREDAVAEALHEDWRRVQLERKLDPGVEWATLPDHLKESNRHAADHFEVKLRAIGYHSAPLGSRGAAVTAFNDDQVALLAKLEHLRWNAERWVDGWTQGSPKDTARKISPFLVPWEGLSDDAKNNDIEQVRAIPRVLGRIGRGVYR